MYIVQLCWNCTLSKWRFRIYCCTYCIALYFFALYFLCCNRAWYMDIITRTQNHEVVLHFTIACCNIGVYTGVYCYIVVLVHGYIRAQNQGCSVTPVSCCSTSSLAQPRPTIHNTGRLDHDTHKFSTIPTNSWASPQCGFHTDALISADPFLISLDICVSTKSQIHIHNTGRLDPDTHKFSVHCWIHRCLDFSSTICTKNQTHIHNPERSAPDMPLFNLQPPQVNLDFCLAESLPCLPFMIGPGERTWKDGERGRLGYSNLELDQIPLMIINAALVALLSASL